MVNHKNFNRALFSAFGLIGLSISFYLVVTYRKELSFLYTSPQGLRCYVRGWGWYGPLIFIGLQVLQVVVFIIPGEITQLAGGYLFGFWVGLLYSLIGIALGSSFNFSVARVLGKPLVLRIFGPKKIEKFAHLMESSKAKRVLFLLFLLPGFPKDLLCYVAGLGSYRFPYFLLLSTLGRLPGLIISSYLGDAAALQAWKEALIGLSLGALLLATGWWVRGKFLHKNKDEDLSSGLPPEEV
ncbi:MAG: TVP38/TMEM64 family protein [Spirochaetales bacterium]